MANVAGPSALKDVGTNGSTSDITFRNISGPQAAWHENLCRYKLRVPRHSLCIRYSHKQTRTPAVAAATAALSAVSKQVLVSRKAGEAVLRGAQLFVPGVLGCSAGVSAGDTVAVMIDIGGDNR